MLYEETYTREDAACGILFSCIQNSIVNLICQFNILMRKLI